VVQAWRVNGAMVHSEAGPGARAMFYRDTAAGNTTTLGLPKSPSFHSGLDLVAAATDPGSNTVAGLSQAGGVDPASRGGTQNGDPVPADMLIYGDTGLPRQLPSLLGKRRRCGAAYFNYFRSSSMCLNVITSSVNGCDLHFFFTAAESNIYS
jgi:hypothetical protein